MLSSANFHKDFLNLRVATHEIGVIGLRLTPTIGEAAITALIFEPKSSAFGWQATADTPAEFILERENDHCFKVKVRMNLTLSSGCVRCLDPVPFHCCLDFTIRMLEMEHLGIDEPTALGWHADKTEIDLSSTEDELTGYFSEKVIDLGLILRDQIFLEVPDYPHCAANNDELEPASCRGLSVGTEYEDDQVHNPFVKLFGKAKL